MKHKRVFCDWIFWMLRFILDSFFWYLLNVRFEIWLSICLTGTKILNITKWKDIRSPNNNKKTDHEKNPIFSGSMEQYFDSLYPPGFSLFLTSLIIEKTTLFIQWNLSRFQRFCSLIWKILLFYSYFLSKHSV